MSFRPTFHNGGQSFGAGFSSITEIFKGLVGTAIVDGHLIATYEDGRTVDLGAVVGIDHVELNDDYTLTIYYTDGTSWTSGNIRGEPGAAGSPGHTPEKGVDYWTSADKSEIVQETAESLDIPTKVSDLQNDSGYLTLGTLPIYDGSAD